MWIWWYDNANVGGIYCKFNKEADIYLWKGKFKSSKGEGEGLIEMHSNGIKKK